MRRLLILFAALMMPYFAGAQAQINTKKVKIGDFTQKTTKVVLTGNAFYDGALQDEVAAKWRVSPYEFCTIEDFDILKGMTPTTSCSRQKDSSRKKRRPECSSSLSSREERKRKTA